MLTNFVSWIYFGKKGNISLHFFLFWYLMLEFQMAAKAKQCLLFEFNRNIFTCNYFFQDFIVFVPRKSWYLFVNCIFKTLLRSCWKWFNIHVEEVLSITFTFEEHFSFSNLKGTVNKICGYMLITKLKIINVII